MNAVCRECACSPLLQKECIATIHLRIIIASCVVEKACEIPGPHFVHNCESHSCNSVLAGIVVMQ